jgi:hypothetical protein
VNTGVFRPAAGGAYGLSGADGTYGAGGTYGTYGAGERG